MRVFLPRWSPDGKQIVFNATLPEKISSMYLISSAGGTPQQVLPSEQSQTDANLVTRWKFAGIRHILRPKNADLHYRPQIQARFYLASFNWTLFSPVVAGWTVHRGPRQQTKTSS